MLEYIKILIIKKIVQKLFILNRTILWRKKNILTNKNLFYSLYFLHFLHTLKYMSKQILDNENIRRRLRISSYHTTKKLSTFMVTMPVSMDMGWNLLHMNLAEFTIASFKTAYVETVCVKVHANCRLRRIYFSDQLYEEDQLPKAYRVLGTMSMREKPKIMLRKKAVGVDTKSTTVQTDYKLI